MNNLESQNSIKIPSLALKNDVAEAGAESDIDDDDKDDKDCSGSEDNINECEDNERTLMMISAILTARLWE